MEIRIAEHAGACFGVNRALDIVRKAADGSHQVYTLGPLIHNPRVVDELARGGVHSAESLDGIPSGATVVIRSHGVVPQVITDALDAGLVVDDATCPLVKRVHKAAEELHGDGYRVVVVGEKGHAEVEGICAYAGPDAVVAIDPSELPDDLPPKVGVVVQTTQSAAALQAIVEALRPKVEDLQLRNTICLATRQRQQAAAALAAQADVMIVIGGRNSGNTRRLVAICSEACPRTHHIESQDELDPAWFEGARVVGITAGASTPADHIHAVVAALEALR
ncbi:MAG: 4-hydroxy-3-methylbut-2-enyl diphosphate reductase [Coriobacteriales bacterium]|nr:4-hydroxy-3-methylbut-2-enyl diphosphate reductase [Coriobacteriales bacterium]